MSPARFYRTSRNRKLSPVDMVPVVGGYKKLRPVARAPFCASTYAAIQRTCSDMCPFKRGKDGTPHGCFTDSGFTRILQAKMDAAAEDLTPLEVARCESALINEVWRKGVPQDGARGGRDLRLHVGGDARDTASAELLAGAAERWRARRGGAVWTFTHSWRDIPRRSWGPISVLASVETPEQAHHARVLGYAPAIVVPSFPAGDRAWQLTRTLRAIPCPAETRGRTCVECRLCLDRDLHRMRVVIAFQAHGRTAGRAVQALEAA